MVKESNWTFKQTKEYVQLGNVLKALEYKNALLQVESLNPQQKLQFEGYWERFIHYTI